MSYKAGRVLGFTEGIPAPAKNNPSAKARVSRAGTRSVSTLNDKQLARKRENDREAQREMRQRTREHIERLENRIKELSGDPKSDPALEEAQWRNLELEEELRQLKRQLQERQLQEMPKLNYDTSILWPENSQSLPLYNLTMTVSKRTNDSPFDGLTYSNFSPYLPSSVSTYQPSLPVTTQAWSDSPWMQSSFQQPSPQQQSQELETPHQCFPLQQQRNSFQQPHEQPQQHSSFQDPFQQRSKGI